MSETARSLSQARHFTTQQNTRFLNKVQSRNSLNLSPRILDPASQEASELWRTHAEVRKLELVEVAPELSDRVSNLMYGLIVCICDANCLPVWGLDP